MALHRWLLTGAALLGSALSAPAFLGPAQQLQRLKADYINYPVLSPDAHWMAMAYVGLTDKEKSSSHLAFLNVQTGQLKILPLEAPLNFRFLPDRRTLVTGFGFRTGVNFVDAATGKAREPFEPLPDSPEYSRFAPFPDGSYVMAANGGHDPTVALRAKATRPLALPAQAALRFPLAFSPQGTVLVTKSAAGLSVVNPKTWQTVREIPSKVAVQVYDAVFSPNGRFIALGEQQLQVIDVTTGKVNFTLPTAAQVSALAFSPDGKKIVVGLARSQPKITDHASGQVLQVFDAATGKLLQTVTRAESRLDALAFTPDGRGLVAVLTDQYFDRSPSIYVATVLKFKVTP
ncbi:WD40 repeat domain-containing protein [Deinococcus multiflagellatus]|uniref:WD40 repeat domain-containing protein n=1 Tax=Deinococcus multiflagellatus TaxID=1656887 RepID=A0ABW1ZS46_9DEIO|nr:hypothetical protein [Deinococcus multiflagellatus]MBZ9715943.1 hypothetical protein [Deinococcus multiflagellatus]